MAVTTLISLPSRRMAVAAALVCPRRRCSSCSRDEGQQQGSSRPRRHLLPRSVRSLVPPPSPARGSSFTEFIGSALLSPSSLLSGAALQHKGHGCSPTNLSTTTPLPWICSNAIVLLSELLDACCPGILIRATVVPRCLKVQIKDKLSPLILCQLIVSSRGSRIYSLSI